MECDRTKDTVQIGSKQPIKDLSQPVIMEWGRQGGTIANGISQVRRGEIHCRHGFAGLVPAAQPLASAAYVAVWRPPGRPPAGPRTAAAWSCGPARSRQELAALWGVHRQSVAAWLTAYAAGGVAQRRRYQVRG